MAYRIDLRADAGESVLHFTGLFDETALLEVRARLTSARPPVRLVLCVGTDVAPGCIADLRRLPVPVTAESPFLTAWLAAT